ncbi:MAG: DUF2188 domain-containing protein [Pseudomonadota bacterium]
MLSYKSSAATRGQENFEESRYLLRDLIRDLKTKSGIQLLRRIGLEEHFLRDLSKHEKDQLLTLLKQYYEDAIVPPISQELEEIIRLRDPGEWLPWESEAISKVDKWRRELASKPVSARSMLRKALEQIRYRYPSEAGPGRQTRHGSEFRTEDLNRLSQRREGTVSATNDAPGGEFAEAPSDSAQKAYDLAISFVPEDFDLAQGIASRLQDMDLRVFHGSRYVDDLWGMDLAEHLAGVYWSARLCLVIMSKFYRVREWTEFEMGLLARKAQVDSAYALMIAQYDDEPLPDILTSFPTFDVRSLSVDTLCEQVKAGIESLPEPGSSESRCSEQRIVRVISREGAWAVKPQEAYRALRVFDTREQAVEFSAGLQERDPCMEVVVHNSDGTVHKRVPSHL